MRIYACDHCGKQEQVSFANRRPVGWSTLRSSVVIAMNDDAILSTRKGEVQYELCTACTASLKTFMRKRHDD